MDFYIVVMVTEILVNIYESQREREERGQFDLMLERNDSVLLVRKKAVFN